MGFKDRLAGVPGFRAAARGLGHSRQWVHWRLWRPAYPAGELRLHLGCGDIDHPGFVNIDARPRPHVHHVRGLDDLSIFKDGSVAMIYTSHCLEHVSHRRVPRVLEEWHRVLRPGGRLRISVPDFELLVQAYLDTGHDIRSVQQPLMGAQDYALNFHHCAFNAAELSRLLIQAGFKAPRPWKHGCDDFGSLPDWSGRSMTCGNKDYPVSLNLEADR
jgi:predicted SAM-dependent methyltransferase